MKSTNPRAEPTRNSTCRDVGHDWKTTAAANYRVCQRHKCRTAQRLQQGTWVNAVPQRTSTDPLTTSHQQHAMPQQSSLF